MHSEPNSERRTRLLLAAATVACLAPFAGRAFNIDEPLFLWAARHIQSHPLDFYGFSVNWSDTVGPMSKAMLNPPLVSYLIAAVTPIVGWGEVGLHLVFLLPAVAAVLGTYSLARRLCSHPGIAALAALLTPAFLISSTSVMCDTTMLAFWVWAVVLWLEGVEKDQHWRLAVSAVLITLCALTKYYGAALIPLLVATTYWKKRRFGAWALHFAIPIAALIVYESVTSSMYGQGLLSLASSGAADVADEIGSFDRATVTLAFAGGSILPALAFTPYLWSRKMLLAGVALTGAAIALIASNPSIARYLLHTSTGARWDIIVPLAVLAMTGVSILALAVADQLSNSTGFVLKPASVKCVEALRFPVFQCATVMNTSRGAGFYSSIWGPLPRSRTRPR